MSDLSQLLGDLYGASEIGDNEETMLATRAPAWSSEEALDDAFSEWVPGPAQDAPTAERSLVADAVMTAPVDPLDYADDWVAATEPAVVEVPVLHWTPSDDDILPARRGPRRRRRRR